MDATFGTNDMKFHKCSHWCCLCQLHGSLQATKHVVIWWSG
jgi:hypothetical protein